RFFGFTCGMNFVGMNICGKREEFLLERIRIQPRSAWLVEQGEVVGHFYDRMNRIHGMGNRNEILTILLILSKVLGAETFAAGTARGGVWVFHLEAAVLQSLDVIQFAAGDVK